jgi:hypothetical protein
MIPGMCYLFHTSGIHVFEDAPQFSFLVQVLAQKRLVYVLAVAVLAAAATRRLDLKSRPAAWPTLLCASMGLVPILILYEVSVHTAIHVFVPRYRIVAVPGAALCWAFVVNRIRSQELRLMFCIGIVGVGAYSVFSSPLAGFHDYSWKTALELVEKNTAADHVPVLLCSDLPESNSMPLPVGAALKDSILFAPLSYYPLSGTVVGLPRGLNDQAKQIASRFVRQAAQKHQRFLALSFMASWETLDWITDYSDPSHDMRELGTFDGIQVLEYTPNQANMRH